ncbi:hypothetical protein [Zoogloea sp.]|uniref:hypothetical protein n=1 Tax=Zoogloea sp. TaxID=49181 RepID=UPI0035AE2C07
MAFRIPPPKTPTDGTLLTSARKVADDWYQPPPPKQGPQWRLWVNLPAVELWQAITLSCDIEPTYYLGGADPEFQLRMRIAIGNGLGKGDRPHCALVTLTDVACLARRCGWTLPPEFPKPEPVLARADAELGPEEAAGSDKDLVNPPVRPKRQKQADRIKACLAECERRAAEKGLVFDLQNMPGAKADLLDFLHNKDGDNLGSIKGVSSLDRYLKGVCKWSNSAHANPPATPLYAQLFPELKWAPRAVLKKPTQQRKA